MKFIYKFVILILGLFIFINVNANNRLEYDVYNPEDKSIFAVSSTLIEGKKEIILVDTQFQQNDAWVLVDKIKKSGKKLKLIYISQSDPDYYFGTNVLHENFPDVKIVSTLQTAYLIKMTKDQKLKYWSNKLKENAPKDIIIPEGITNKYLKLDGNKIYIMQDKNNPDKSYLWDPNLKIILGGVLLNYGSHIWLADSQQLKDLENWLNQLKKMKKLKAKNVIPGHYLNLKRFNEGFNQDIINFNINYITNAIEAYKKSSNSKEFISIMKRYYPDLPEVNTLEFSAKVLKGEEKWPVVKSYYTADIKN